jgi:hypothetical protein
MPFHDERHGPADPSSRLNALDRGSLDEVYALAFQPRQSVTEGLWNALKVVQGGEEVPLDEALDFECLSTHAAASNLLCEAHDREDPLVFAEAQLRAEAIARTLDRTVDAYGVAVRGASRSSGRTWGSPWSPSRASSGGT